MRHENSYEDNLPTSAVLTAKVTRDTVPSSTEIPAQTAGVTDDTVPSSKKIPAETAEVTRDTVPSSMEIPAPTAGVTADAVPSSTEIPAQTAGVTGDTVPSSTDIPAQTSGVTGDAVPSYRSCDMFDGLTSLTNPAIIYSSQHCELSTAQHQQFTEIPAQTAGVTRDTVPSCTEIPAQTAGVTGDTVPSYRSCDMFDGLTSLTNAALISSCQHCELSTAQHQQSTDIPCILHQVATSSYDFVPAVQCASTAAAIT